jgi:hypothetical protein
VVGRIGAASDPRPAVRPPMPVLDLLAVAVGRGLARALVPRRPSPTRPPAAAIPIALPSAPAVGRGSAAPRPALRAPAPRPGLRLVRGGPDGG